MSNPLKIISQIKLNWNPIGWKNILYGGENFHFCKLLFICSFLQKLPCSRIFHRSEKNLAHFLFRMFQNRHFPKPDSSLILHCSKNFITFLEEICFTARYPSRKLWQGYHLFAVEGSRIELPNSKSTFDFFGEMSSYPDPNRCYTMGLVSIIYDVLDDYILHASIYKFLSSERAAALEHLKVLEDMGLYNNSIIIFDRGYYSEDMFRYCVEHGHLCVMRLKEGINLSKKCNGDMISILQGTSKEGTSDVSIRVLEIPA